MPKINRPLDPNEIECAAQKRTAFRRLGSDKPACAICGETYHGCLEEHHYAQRAYGPNKVTVCRNCHRKLTDRQRLHPPPSGPEPRPLERLGHLLLNLAAFFAELAEQLLSWGRYLLDHVAPADRA